MASAPSPGSPRTRSPWNLLFPPLVLAVGGLAWLGLALAVHALHARAGELPFPLVRSGLAGLLMFAPICLPAATIGLLGANAVARLVPPARRALDAESSGHPGADYAAAQRGLLKAAALLLLVTLPMAVVGALLPP